MVVLGYWDRVFFVLVEVVSCFILVFVIFVLVFVVFCSKGIELG